jgi:hypothetical protein
MEIILRHLGFQGNLQSQTAFLIKTFQLTRQANHAWQRHPIHVDRALELDQSIFLRTFFGDNQLDSNRLFHLLMLQNWEDVLRQVFGLQDHRRLWLYSTLMTFYVIVPQHSIALKKRKHLDILVDVLEVRNFDASLQTLGASDACFLCTMSMTQFLQRAN